MAKYEVWILLFIIYIGCSESTSPTTDIKPTPNKHFPKSNQATGALHSASPRVDNYETGDSIPSLLLQPPPNSAFKREYRYMNGDSKPEEGWFGFNQFVSRAARNLPFGTDRKMRTASLLGESTQIYPLATFFPGPTVHFDQGFVFNPHMNDLQSLGTVHHHDPFLNPNLIMMGHSMKFPRGVLIPLMRPQQQSFNNKHQRSFNHHQSTSRSHLQPAANAPMPVTLKIIPLKLTSIDLANALKSVSWMPIPINLLKTNGNQNGKEGSGHQQQTYSDKRHSMFDDDDESNLPPPSSHVATPPLGITYAEGRRSERFVNKFAPRL